ncbi:MAG: MoxR family ATPase [Pseudomonadales bacterium]|nr:MoxR family ATPase [Pseudomonadales bacterium]
MFRPAPIDHAEIMSAIIQLQENITQVIHSNNQCINHLLAAFFSGGHVLLEDVPGTGKTTLAKSLASSIAADFKRIQFTPDLLPGDILGVSIFDQHTQDFKFHKGPIFTHILLADEINRASPRTQSALLEAMAENQVSIDGNRRPMGDPFFVFATQNPIDFHGTYPLPEAQMDRFAMRLELGYVSAENELKILNDQQHKPPLDDLSACLNLEQIRYVRDAVQHISITDELKRYIIKLIAATRNHTSLQMGASPRASITLMKCAQALALIEGRSFVTPDIIQALALPVIAHRLALNSEAQFSGKNSGQIMQDIISQTEVPA